MKNLLAVQEQVRSGKFNLRDKSEKYIQSITDKNEEINAIVHFDADEVKSEADRIQKK